MPHGSLTACADVRALLADHVDGELGAEAAADVDAHLAGCAACSAEHRAERRVLAELRRRVQEVHIPAEVRERLWASLRRAADEELAPPGARVTDS